MIRPIARTFVELGKSRFTTQFPEERESQPDNYRGVHRLDIETCISCGACERICPNKTITMVYAETKKGRRKLPEINLERCLFCGLCQEVCPTHCLTLTKDYDLVAADRRRFIKRPEELK
ncbi:MAG: 4Fe-4S binding protein [Candidatus Micrarchaeia archaeon]